MTDHPAAHKIFTNAFSEAFSTKTASLFYFYSNDESVAKAWHFYPNNPGWAQVIIVVLENQHPLDEFLTVLFEIQNSKNEKRFAKIVENAIDGTISRSQFARETLRAEFDAVRSVRDLLASLKLGKKEKSESKDYSPFINCPNEFEEFLSHIKKHSRKRDAIKEYESQYDLLRSTP